MREARAAARAAAAEAEDSSGRSTPAHLRGVTIETAETETDNNNKNTAKTRTFSETLKMLDDDILAELDVK